MKTVASAQRHARALGLERVDAQYLLLHAVGKPLASRSWLTAHDTDTLTAEQAQVFNTACQRRLAGEPVAYITGWRGFYGLDLQITPDVLDPRPDTETLVDWALEVLRDVPHAAAPRVLDLGTGSGAIALAIKSQRPDATVVAVDASEAALAVARANAQRLDLGIECVLSDWLASIADEEPFDCIVSNPPYLAEDDVHLPSLRHEPSEALVAANNGLQAYETITAQAKNALHAGGWLLFEHGWQQHAAVRAMMQSAGYTALDSRTDLAGHVRCTGGQYAG